MNLIGIESEELGLNTWIEIDRDALIGNYRLFESLSGSGKLLPVVKSNAYGHGLEMIARPLIEEGCPQLGVNDLEEAAALRDLDFSGRIIVLGPLLADDVAGAVEINAEVFLGGPEVLKKWVSLDQRPKAHIKFDTGMSRQGFRPEQCTDVIQWLGSERRSLVGVATHLANVEDVLEHQYASAQLEKFKMAADELEAGGMDGLERHAASSASCLLIPEARFDLCRVGISLYGLWPSKATRLSYLNQHGSVPDLRPVLSWKCRVVYVQDVAKGQFVGYGCTYRAVQPMKIGVLPIGYHEGYRRIIGEAPSYVLIKGHRCPIVGRICMNMTMVDVSHVPDIGPGDEVTVIGSDQGEVIETDTVASWCKTINYEIVTNLNSSLSRRYL